MLNSRDILIITLVIIIIGIIIVINVKKSLNNKLSHVQVKIPDIKIPPSNITVRVQKKCDEDNYDVFIGGGGEKNYSSNIGFLYKEENKIENFGNINENMQESAEQESTEQNNAEQQNENQKVQFRENIDDSIEETSEKNINFPNKSDIIDYDNYLCINKKFLMANSEKFTDNSEKITNIKNMKKYNNENTQKILDKEQTYINDDYDSLRYFLKNKKIIPTSFEDGVTRGANIDNYGSYGGLNDIGKIKLTNNKLYAKPANYLFYGREI